VFVNRVLREIFGHKREEVLYAYKNENMYINVGPRTIYILEGEK
jgi:hypothetical protein